MVIWLIDSPLSMPLDGRYSAKNILYHHLHSCRTINAQLKAAYLLGKAVQYLHPMCSLPRSRPGHIQRGRIPPVIVQFACQAIDGHQSLSGNLGGEGQKVALRGKLR